MHGQYVSTVLRQSNVGGPACTHNSANAAHYTSKAGTAWLALPNALPGCKRRAQGRATAWAWVLQIHSVLYKDLKQPCQTRALVTYHACNEAPRDTTLPQHQQLQHVMKCALMLEVIALRMYSTARVELHVTRTTGSA